MIIKPEYNKKNQMAELIHRKLAGGDVHKDSPFDIREIELHVENALNKKMKINILETSLSGDKSVDGQYIVSFEDIPILTDTARSVTYINLPAKHISLSYGRGLYAIEPMNNNFSGFIPVRNGSKNMLSLREAPYLQGQVGFYQEGNRAVFIGDLSKIGVDRVVVKLIVAADGDKIDVNVPADMELEVIDYVYGFLVKKIPEDKVNDNNETV